MRSHLNVCGNWGWSFVALEYDGLTLIEIPVSDLLGVQAIVVRSCSWHQIK